MEEQFVCGFILDFKDGGPQESQVLYIGTEEKCEEVMKMTNAVSYKGDRVVKKASLKMVKVEYDTLSALDK